MHARLEWKLADMWIGVFWRSELLTASLKMHTDVWVCIVPCVPLHLWWERDVLGDE